MAKREKVPVSERAVFARVDRALRQQGKALRRCRPTSRAFAELGRYYIINTDRAWIDTTHVDLQTFARKTWALGPEEELVEDA